ncbi:E3 ubiquitin-protein ligase sh3rf3 [Homalodisca vitripennis]|nr:E3 ubiquitin-protein ligase sh3rf3 [Homalodisca vitripennis]
MEEWMLNDLLECSVCLERLDTSSKVLPCQHTFCRKCLEDIYTTNRELRCPECRVLVDARIDELPPNVLLMRILEGMRNAGPNKRNSTGSVRQASSSVQPPNTHAVPEPNARLQQPLSGAAVKIPSQPYARAVYDYLSKEPGDLSFKKGDLIILRKKIDSNWYHGECGSNQGVFPLSYVQVMNSHKSVLNNSKSLVNSQSQVPLAFVYKYLSGDLFIILYFDFISSLCHLYVAWRPKHSTLAFLFSHPFISLQFTIRFR